MTNLNIAINLTNGARGSFMAALGEAYCCADSRNKYLLRIAFPHIFIVSEDPPTEYPEFKLGYGFKQNRN